MHALADPLLLQPTAWADALADALLLQPTVWADTLAVQPTAPTSRHCECDRRRASSLLMWETMLQTATEERCLRGIVRPVARLASTQRREE